MDKLERDYCRDVIPEALLTNSTSPPAPPAPSTPYISTRSYSSSYAKLDPSSTKSTDVDTIDFLKYTNFRLRSKDDIIILYHNVCQKG